MSVNKFSIDSVIQGHPFGIDLVPCDSTVNVATSLSLLLAILITNGGTYCHDQ